MHIRYLSIKFRCIHIFLRMQSPCQYNRLKVVIYMEMHKWGVGVCRNYQKDRHLLQNVRDRIEKWNPPMGKQKLDVKNSLCKSNVDNDATSIHHTPTDFIHKHTVEKRRIFIHCIPICYFIRNKFWELEHLLLCVCIYIYHILFYMYIYCIYNIHIYWNFTWGCYSSVLFICFLYYNSN